MKICDTRNHGEIVFEGRDCKACETIQELQGRIHDLEVELEEALRDAKE